MAGLPQITDITSQTYLRCRRDGLAVMRRRGLRRPQHEREIISARTSAALKVATRGKRLGNPNISLARPKCELDHSPMRQAIVL
jgi:hypothetical protein